MSNKKFRLLIVLVMSCFLAFSFFSIYSINKYSENQKKVIVEKIYNETARHANKMNEVFKSAEGVVNTLHANVYSTFDTEKLSNESNYLKSYMSYLKPIIKESVYGFEGGSGLFMTFDPALKNYTAPYEIWYAYDKTGKIKFIDAAANGVYLEAFKQKDASYMQFWFKSIANREKGIYTEIHYDPDIKKDVFGYCRSVYKNEKLIGVLGTTLSSDDLYRSAQKMQLDNDGYILLLSEKNNLMQAFTEKNGEYKQTKTVPKELVNAVSLEDSGVKTVKLEDKKMLLTYYQMSNGWAFAIANNEKEIFAKVEEEKALNTFVAFLFSIIIIFFAYSIMKNYSSPLEKAMKMLRTLDIDEEIKSTGGKVKRKSDIESFVREHVNKQRAKDIYVAQISRQAEIGEMLETVMHQWKQPLNKINLMVGNLKDLAKDNISEEEVNTFAGKTEKVVSDMVETLEDFTEYMKPDKAISSFNINDVIQAAIVLLGDDIIKNNIKINWHKEDMPNIKGYKNALYHVIVNIISNGIDAIKVATLKEPIINIIAKEEKGELLIEIFNTGNAIPDDIAQKLFTPYFTTREEAGGTGMGLLISKNLIENMMGGSISLFNKADGVMCLIKIKL
ncbi:MAG: sensor histidine kinase [Anaerovoracaceae bacterium]